MLLFCQITLGGGQAEETGPASEMAQMPAKECVRPVKHKEEDCTEVTEVTVKLPAVDTNAIGILSLVHILEIYSMSAMFPVKKKLDLGSVYDLNDN